VKPRPTQNEPELVRATSKKLVDDLNKLFKWDESELPARVNQVADVLNSAIASADASIWFFEAYFRANIGAMDGYQLTKRLDVIFGWPCSVGVVDIMRSAAHLLIKEHEAAVKNWVTINLVRPTRNVNDRVSVCMANKDPANGTICRVIEPVAMYWVRLDVPYGDDTRTDEHRGICVVPYEEVKDAATASNLSGPAAEPNVRQPAS